MITAAYKNDNDQSDENVVYAPNAEKGHIYYCIDCGIKLIRSVSSRGTPFFRCLDNSPHTKRICEVKATSNRNYTADVKGFSDSFFSTILREDPKKSVSIEPLDSESDIDFTLNDNQDEINPDQDPISTELEIDENGRLIIPPGLVIYAGDKPLFEEDAEKEYTYSSIKQIVDDQLFRLKPNTIINHIDKLKVSGIILSTRKNWRTAMKEFKGGNRIIECRPCGLFQDNLKISFSAYYKDNNNEFVNYYFNLSFSGNPEAFNKYALQLFSKDTKNGKLVFIRKSITVYVAANWTPQYKKNFNGVFKGKRQIYIPK